MKMAFVKSFFGCYRLEIGGIIIGWLGILIQFPLVIVCLGSDFYAFDGKSQLPGILFSILSLILIIINILLLIGIEKSKSDSLLPWLIIYFKVFFVALIFGTGRLFHLVITSTGAGQIMLFIILISLYWTFFVYSWFLVLALYERISSLGAATYNSVNRQLLENGFSNSNGEPLA